MERESGKWKGEIGDTRLNHNYDEDIGHLSSDICYQLSKRVIKKIGIDDFILVDIYFKGLFT